MDFENIKDIYDAVGGIEGISKGAKSLKGIFGKKKDSPDNSIQTNQENGFSQELNNLMELIIEDGEITDDEMQLLRNKAEKEGIDPLEIEIVVKKKLKKKKEKIEWLKTPVNQIIESFKLAEECAKGGNSAINGTALSSALALIPGVGQAAMVGSLASSIIKTPSNLNKLKAEIINNISIPDDEQQLADFLLFSHSQLELAKNANKNKNKSISGFLSSVTMGDELNLAPVWQTKIDHLISRGKLLFPNSEIVRTAINQVYVSPAKQLSNYKIYDFEAYYSLIETLPVPEDDIELMEVIEFAFFNKEDDRVLLLHKRMYKAAEIRFSNSSSLLEQLKKYRIKKFGLF